LGDFLPNNNACIILRDDLDRYVDSTPCLQGGGLGDLFSNDYTWPRVPDGSNVWMFQQGINSSFTLKSPPMTRVGGKS
jgi:hypothetical protein